MGIPMFRYYSTALLVAGMVLTVSVAHSDVFNLPPGQTSLQFVTVGDPGNTADSSGYGSVGYVYQMGEYDVTVGQYVQFLNAVAQTDTYGLYNSYMAVGSYAGYHLTTIGITQSGTPGSYTYSVAGSDSQAANVPIFHVTWGDAARFCNWLQNGQPTGPEGNGTTETGAYTLDGDTTNLTTGPATQGPRTSSPRTMNGTRPPFTREEVKTRDTGRTKHRATRHRTTRCRRPARTMPTISAAPTAIPRTT